MNGIETRNFVRDGERLVEITAEQKRAPEAAGQKPFLCNSLFIDAADAQGRADEIEALTLPYVKVYAVTGGVWLVGGYMARKGDVSDQRLKNSSRNLPNYSPLQRALRNFFLLETSSDVVPSVMDGDPLGRNDDGLHAVPELQDPGGIGTI